MTNNVFQKRTISPLESRVERKAAGAERWIKSHIFLSIVMIILGLLTLRGIVGAIRTGDPFSVSQIMLSAVGNGLETDSYGHTNILLLGIGGEGHDGANLTDTMMVASLDSSDNTVSIISVPRDIYTENDEVGFGTKLNSIYEYVLDKTESPTAAAAEVQKEIENILGVKIQYYAKIDFQGFTEIVDALGGITVDVKEAIADTSYPSDSLTGSVWDPFYLSAGVQDLDGETALKYARSRHTTSDYDRAARQQEVIAAIKDKALSAGVLGSPSKIKAIYFAITDNFETNLSLSELLELAGEAEDIEKDSISSTVITEEANKQGGFLYAGEREEGDPFYLVPYAGDFSETEAFTQLFFYHPEVFRNKVPVEVLNGTREDSLAGLTKMYLVRRGIDASFGNALAKGQADTIICMPEGVSEADKEAANSVLNILPSMTFGEIKSECPNGYSLLERPTEAKIIIILGDDFATYYHEHENLFYLGFY